MSRGLKSIGLFLAFVLIFSLSRHHLFSSTSTTTTSVATSTTTTYSSTCDPKDMTAAFVGGQGAAGTIYGQWTLTKNSGADCVLYGYALVTYQDSFGALLPIHLTHTPLDHVSYFADQAANQAPQRVSMQVGSVAHIDFSYSDVQIDNGSCPTVSAISLQFHQGGGTMQIATSSSNVGLFAPCSGKTLISPFF